MESRIAPLGPGDEEAFSGVMEAAFREDPSLAYFLGPGAGVGSRRCFLAFLFRYALLTGGVVLGAWKAGGLAACCVAERPRPRGALAALRALASLPRVVREALAMARGLPAGSLGRMNRYMRAARSGLPRGPRHYLTMLGTAPEARGAGLGAALVRRVAEEARAAGLDLYLDTENPANPAWYAGLGFGLLDSRRLAGLEIFRLRLESRGSRA